MPVGIPAQILAAARTRQFTVITSAAIISEVLRVLTYPRIQRRYHVGPAEIDSLHRFLRRRALVTLVVRDVHGVATHPEDDLILATALSAQADYLVTGDAHLQELITFESTTIVSPQAFLTLLRQPPLA